MRGGELTTFGLIHMIGLRLLQCNIWIPKITLFSWISSTFFSTSKSGPFIIKKNLDFFIYLK